MKLSLKGFQGPSAPSKAQMAFEANAFDLINFRKPSKNKSKTIFNNFQAYTFNLEISCRQSFSQGDLEGRRK